MSDRVKKVTWTAFLTDAYRMVWESAADRDLLLSQIASRIPNSAVAWVDSTCIAIDGQLVYYGQWVTIEDVAEVQIWSDENFRRTFSEVTQC